MGKGFIIYTGIITILLCLFFSSASYAEELIRINPLRYDCSTLLNWGYSATWNDEDLDSTFEKFQDMPQSELQDIYDHPENWGKGWIQFVVSPSWVNGVIYLGYDAIPEALKEITGKYSDRGLLYYGNMSIENIRISNSNEMGIYPYYYMQVLYNEDADTDDSMISNEWILEFVYKKAANPDDLLKKKIQSICLYADIYMLHADGFYIYKDVQIDLKNIEKATPLNISIISVRLNKAELCTEGNDPNLDTACNIIHLDDELDRDADNLPSYLYALDLDISINDDISVTPYDFEKQPIEDSWIVFLEDESQETVWGPVKNAKLEGYYLLTNKKITDICTGELWLSFCTAYIQGKEWFNEIPFNIIIEIQ